MWGRRRRLVRCETPACHHPHTTFAAPVHLLAERCDGVRWWSGCAAWFAGHCQCGGCVPEQASGPGATECRCPASAPADALC